MKETPVTARSERAIRRELLRYNRFLGLHQVLWAPMLTTATMLATTRLEHDWSPYPLAAAILLASYALVELLFLPRRLAIRRVARTETRNQRVRLAMKHKLSISAVKVVDR